MNVNDIVHLFNGTIKIILHNFIPHETITCDDRDSSRINSSIGCLSKMKMRHISTLKEETTTVSTLKTFRIY